MTPHTFPSKIVPFLSLTLVLTVAGCSGRDGAPTGPELQATRDLLAQRIGAAPKEQKPAEPAPAGRPDPARLADDFYRKRDFWPAWTSVDESSPAADLRRAIANAPSHGLDASGHLGDYASDTKQAFSPNERAERDRALTTGFFAYALDLAVGRVEPSHGPAPLEADLIALLESSLATDTVGDTLETLAPTHPQYRALREARAKLVLIGENGGWPLVAGVGGDESNPSPVLAQRLAIEERLQPISAEEAPPGDDVVEAIKRFQYRHGLEPTGTLDEETQAALDVPVADRIRQVDLALERWRWLPQRLGDRHVWVNVPEFALAAVEGDRTVLGMRIIAGKSYDATPFFFGDMTHLVFNPYWNIPERIAAEEILPKGEEYMKSQGIEVVGSNGDVPRLRQVPGPKNPLGQVKFMFPNEHAIYLHDTQADQLFDRRDRRLSHGCIRVEKPIELAEYVLGPNGDWDRAKIEELITSDEEKTVPLREKIPVYIAYFTAIAVDDGKLAFRNDIYEYDRELAERLSGAQAIASRDQGHPAD